jgi:hypothetical protein
MALTVEGDASVHMCADPVMQLCVHLMHRHADAGYLVLSTPSLSIDIWTPPSRTHVFPLW